jgi:hypothetical protein
MFAKVIAGLSFLMIIVITIWLITRDNYIVQQCDARLASLTNELNAFEESKFAKDLYVTKRVNSMDGNVDTLKNTLLSQDTLLNDLNTQSLTVSKMDAVTIGSHDFDVVGQALMKNKISYAGIGQGTNANKYTSIRKECILVDA